MGSTSELVRGQMPEYLQAACQMRDVQIEALYKQLTQVADEQARNEILKQIEMVTGVKIFY